MVFIFPPDNALKVKVPVARGPPAIVKPLELESVRKPKARVDGISKPVVLATLS